jgi:hypothetical protein
MSSATYFASLAPDPWLRIVVLTSGRLLLAAGVVMILTVEASAALRGAGCLGWLGLGCFELRRVERGFQYCKALRVRPGGEIELQNPDLEWEPATLQSGSVLMGHFAWLRVQTGGGRQCAEFLQGDARASPDWRRLRVIWRHIGA